MGRFQAPGGVASRQGVQGDLRGFSKVNQKIEKNKNQCGFDPEMACEISLFAKKKPNDRNNI